MDKKKNTLAYISIIATIIIIVFVCLFITRQNSSKAQKSESSPDTDIIQNINDNSELLAYLDEQNTIMADMMKNMSLKASGNADLDFLIGMIPHHEAAVEISKIYLTYGNGNSELKSLAENIIEVQTNEIENMRQLITKMEKSGETDPKKEQSYLDRYNKMLSSHKHIEHETEAAKNVDAAFAEGMIIHHQMAIDMAEAILDFSDTREICDLANDIIRQQKDDISQMEQLFKDL